jgi:hypothetical protein
MNLPIPTKKAMDPIAFGLYMRDFFESYVEKEEPYLDERLRKLRLYAYCNRQRSEAKFMKRFKDKFGGPEECTVFLGDWDAKHTMQGQVCRLPVLCVDSFKDEGLPQDVRIPWIHALACE